jgi:hypothetical protein
MSKDPPNNSSDAKIVAKFEKAQSSLVLQSSDLSLDTIAKMTIAKSIDISPKYQRRERWKPDAESALIESFLLNVPVPPVYIAEDDFGTYSVIDGKQRITAISRYLNGEYALNSLAKYKEIEGMRFSELPASLRNALSIRPYLRVVTLLKQTDPQLKYEVFTRLNTGGQPLLPQEIRNALYRGSLNDLLFELASNKHLRKQLKIATEKESAYTEMSDVEMTLRFFTLREEWDKFSGDYRRSMDSFMERNMTASKSALDKMRRDFSGAMDRCETLWGDQAFRRYVNGNFRDQFLAAVFDSQMIAASTLSSTQFNKLKTKITRVRKEMADLFNNAAFEQSVRVSTNTPTRVKLRIGTVSAMLKKIANS